MKFLLFLGFVIKTANLQIPAVGMESVGCDTFEIYYYFHHYYDYYYLQNLQFKLTGHYV